MIGPLLRAYFRTPEHPGKYRVARWLGRHAFPDQGIVKTVPPGVRLWLHPRDWIEYVLLRGEAYEPLTLDFMRRNLRAGDAAVLAGVNFGLHAIVAAQAVGPAGQVVGFEPQPAALMRAHANLLLNGVAERVKLVAAALGQKARLLPMAWSKEDNPGAASFLDRGPGLEVQLLPLREALPVMTEQTPRLVLLDVQGYEVGAVLGLDRKNPPDILVVEALDDWLRRANTSLADLLFVMREWGYDLFTLDGNPADEGTELPEANVIGVRPGAAVEWPST